MQDATTVAQAYIWGVVIGAPITFALVETTHRGVDRSFSKDSIESMERIRWLPALLGMLERGAFMTILIFALPAAGTIIGGWIALKAAGGWGKLAESTAYNRAVYMVGLLGSMSSALWAISVTAAYGLVNQGKPL